MDKKNIFQIFFCSFLLKIIIIFRKLVGIYNELLQQHHHNNHIII